MRAARTDTNQAQIVAALRKAGCYVRVIREPVDLLVGIPNGRGTRFLLMEVKKTSWKRARADQKAQSDFIDRHHVPVVKTPEEALIASGLMHPKPCEHKWEAHYTKENPGRWVCSKCRVWRDISPVLGCAQPITSDITWELT